jgi:hypothetical protein
MGYKIVKLANSCGSKTPTISISESDPDWQESLEKWKKGKNPTDSPEWKKGVFALTKLIE